MPIPPLASAAAAAKRRHWHKALSKHRVARSPQTVLSVSARPLAALLECAPDGDALMLAAPEEDNDEQQQEDDDDDSDAPSLAHKLPTEMMQLVLGLLDGDSLLACALVCRALAQLTFDRDVWRNVCMHRWPTLRTQVLAQLPGAPDYDLIRLYGGCWRRCFVEKHERSQRAELRVEIPKFPALSALAVEKIVSETFAIGEHRFCLWIFPNGNPNEQQYAGKVLSVYLVLTDLDRRPPSWLTCAVFSLAVANHADESKRIEWHSCLVDNKFDSQLNNWGVHSLGALKTLTNPANGFLRDEALTVTAKVRLMSITFRVVREEDLKRHHHLGLVDLARVDSIELPFCCTLQDLLLKLRDKYGAEPDQLNVWCFNQPVVSGQALRPRKLLTQPKVDRHQPMFGNLLCDGVDIDAYSFCQIYVESKTEDDAPLDAGLPIVAGETPSTFIAACGAPGTSSYPSAVPAATSLSSTTDAEANAAVPIPNAYIFVKIMNPSTNQLQYIGRIRFAPQLSSGAIYECVAKRLGCVSSEMVMYKEEIAPTVFSGPVPWHTHALEPQFSFYPADIVIFTLRTTAAQAAFTAAMQRLLQSRYAHAESLLQNTTCMVPTLETIETLAEQLDIPKFRVRSAFRKCREDPRRTLKYIMEGRHLGFICDSCGETDFKGPRFNCTICTDYDLCYACNAQCHQVNHRYANVDGKWQRIYNFKDHGVAHPMREMMPVFFQYRGNTSSDRQQFANSLSCTHFQHHAC